MIPPGTTLAPSGELRPGPASANVAEAADTIPRTNEAVRPSGPRRGSATSGIGVSGAFSKSVRPASGCSSAAKRADVHAVVKARIKSCVSRTCLACRVLDRLPHCRPIDSTSPQVPLVLPPRRRLHLKQRPVPHPMLHYPNVQAQAQHARSVMERKRLELELRRIKTRPLRDDLTALRRTSSTFHDRRTRRPLLKTWTLPQAFAFSTPFDRVHQFRRDRCPRRATP